ncbi:MAG: beta-propeller fold lactonase family protein [Planctomycetota bacterium]|nr:beta-propeller fold lactonase family protein [Planctomycetota bacterium]
MRTPAVVSLLVASAGALAQSTSPAVFVANNGNLRGSVTSLRINADGTLAMVQDLVTAEVPSGQSNPGTNAYAISISPDGRFLAVSHATAATITERITLIRVNPDATLTLTANATTPDSPLDVEWLTDRYLVATRTRSSGANEVILYRFDETAVTLTEVDRAGAGSFASRLAIADGGSLVIVNDSPLSGGAVLRVFRVDFEGETIDEVGSAPTGTTYALGMGLTPDGTMLYVGGGASTPYRVGGLSLDISSGSLAALPGSPYTSIGTSPKECVVSPDGRFVYVGHGTDSSIRLQLRGNDGALSESGPVYDVGIQGSLGDMATLRLPGPTPLDLLLFTDKETFDNTPRGIFSAEITPNGQINLRTTRLDTGAISPNDLAVWAGTGAPPCEPDFNQDGSVDQFDIACLALVVAGDPSCAASDPDFNRDGNVDQNDVLALEQVVAGQPCP